MAWYSKHWEEIRPQLKYEVGKWIFNQVLTSSILVGGLAVILRIKKNVAIGWHGFALLTAVAFLLLVIINRPKRQSLQQTASALVNTSGNIAVAVKSLEEFYKLGYGGPFADELEAHFQGLAAYHANPKEREKFLVRSLAAGAVSYAHESAWNDIWKSQIDALKHVNGSGAVVATELKPFYDAAAATYPQIYGDYSFDGWIRFMKEKTLLRQDGNILQITIRGKDFLKYIVLEGKREDWKRY
jgi:hypothetical protein